MLSSNDPACPAGSLIVLEEGQVPRGLQPPKLLQLASAAVALEYRLSLSKLQLAETATVLHKGSLFHSVAGGELKALRDATQTTLVL